MSKKFGEGFTMRDRDKRDYANPIRIVISKSTPWEWLRSITFVLPGYILSFIVGYLITYEFLDSNSHWEDFWYYTLSTFGGLMGVSLFYKLLCWLIPMKGD